MFRNNLWLKKKSHRLFSMFKMNGYHTLSFLIFLCLLSNPLSFEHTHTHKHLLLSQYICRFKHEVENFKSKLFLLINMRCMYSSMEDTKRIFLFKFIMMLLLVFAVFLDLTQGSVLIVVSTTPSVAKLQK